MSIIHFPRCIHMDALTFAIVSLIHCPSIQSLREAFHRLNINSRIPDRDAQILNGATFRNRDLPGIQPEVAFDHRPKLSACKMFLLGTRKGSSHLLVFFAEVPGSARSVVVVTRLHSHILN